ncbi:MAG: glycosyl hydrolase [Bacteroidota bacterium]
MENKWTFLWQHRSKFAWILLSLLFVMPAQAQRKKKNSQATTPLATTTQYDAKWLDLMQWRSIGPYRGGRSCAVTGVPGSPNLYYFGSTGGGVWRTKDGGQTYENISDGFFGGSVGAIAVANSDPNVIYVGGGEKTVRGNVSYGYGVWKTVDAGTTWQPAGLPDSRHISRIRIHPQNPDLVYAAVMGDLYQPTEERGVYRSQDGGETWERILFANADAGAVDLTFDPNNARIMYASTWRIRRTPYSLSSGGDGSALWKSTDGGNTWTNISENEGLPSGTWGIVGVTVSPVNSDRVWAIVENENGGVFRSDNAGKTWKRLNQSRDLRQRAWYYSRIYADPQDEDMVYVVNVSYHRSKDGGKTFKSFRAPHGDHHDLWIAPENPDRMIIGDDGGAQVSFDGGENWSTYYNQPTSQFYRVTTDNSFPYRIYAAQQDNSTIRIKHRTESGSIGERDWEPTAGCECGHIAIDPLDEDIVYGGCYDGFLGRKNHRTGESRVVSVWPDNPMGHGAEGMKYRFQWNFPLFFSPHDPRKLYAASNHLHVSYNGGESWEIISPDLTRNDPEKLGPSGGPITKDNTSVEYYCTIFAAIESPLKKDLIWAGSDDGLLHISQDGGQNWENVTPPDLPEWALINSIEANPYSAGGLYLAATMYKSGDYQPYLYKTKDYGKTWTKITTGIDDGHFTRVIRADPERPGLLYAGTESGMYISFDDGASWQSFQQNLPIVPITDLAWKDKDLVAATQGRGLWLIDDLTPLYQLNSEVAAKDWYLFAPDMAYRTPGYQSKRARNAGMNHPGGVPVQFHLPLQPDSVEVVLSFHEKDGTEIHSFSTKAKEKKDKLKLEDGANQFVWNMRYPAAKKFEGMILWWASMDGPKAVPEKDYLVRLQVGGEMIESPFRIAKDPRGETSQEDLEKQFAFVQSVNKTVTKAHEGIIEIRQIREQIKHYQKIGKEMESWEPILEKGKQIDSTLTLVEEALYQTKNRSGQDPLNFPIRLTNKLAHLNSVSGSGDYAPTAQSYAVKEELTEAIEAELKILETVKVKELPAFNRLVQELSAGGIVLPDTEESE